MKLPNFNLFKRTFVSLVITAEQLKAIKVNTKSGKVVKFASIDVPPGVIINYRVKDRDTLVKLVRELWAKNGIREKYVGVVVPEFSTYTKSLNLPNLTDVEINEALLWRVQEFLPTNIDDVVYDWKISKREKDKAQVLVVAILKDVLFGYIDAVGAAGLSPLVVETPSLSIQRIIDKDLQGKLIIYMSQREAILVVTQNREIVASSVINSDNVATVVTTARQMLTHYSSVVIEKVLVSGVGLTQDLVQYLSYNLGRPVAFADVRAKGLLPGQIQDYLIGYSLQYKDPAEPASELTINLLPPTWAAYYKSQSSGIRAWTLTLIASIVIWSIFLFVIFVYMVLNLQARELQNNEAQAKSEELNVAVAEVKKINALADEVIEFSEDVVYPQEIISLLSHAKTEGITLNYYKVNYDTGEIILRGLSTTRNNLLAFKNSLESQEKFSGVELPVSSLVQEADINFEMRLVYTDFTRAAKPTRLQI
jgi:hypothetical protein